MSGASNYTPEDFVVQYYAEKAPRPVYTDLLNHIFEHSKATYAKFAEFHKEICQHRIYKKIDAIVKHLKIDLQDIESPT